MTKEVNKIVFNEIKKEIINQCDIAVVGLSGGADSTLVAVLCQDALGSKNVYGISMPYDDNDKKTFNKRSVELADYLQINSKTVNIYDGVSALEKSVNSALDEDISPLNLGNMKSRMRMITLYTFAGSLQEKFPDKRVRVVGTGNLSEDWIGYDTKGGDALADFFPIGELLKKEVYSLLEYSRVPESLIDRVPSAGLESGQTDEQDLGYSYDEMSVSVIRGFYGLKGFNKEVDSFVQIRHEKNKHKHEAPYVVSLRKYIDDVNE